MSALGPPSPSFAQTGAEFTLDSDSDLDLHPTGPGPASESYELKSVHRKTKPRPDGSSGLDRERAPERDEDGPRGRVDSGRDADAMGLDERGEMLRRLRRRRTSGSVASYRLYTPDEEDAVVRKFDRNLVVFVAFLYMLSFLDRSSMRCRNGWAKGWIRTLLTLAQTSEMQE
jgi:hypothetical protein